MRSIATLLLGAVLSLSVVPGCGDGGAKTPSRPLPAYTGRAQQLFDDTIDPAAVGLDMDRSFTPKTDAMMRERSQTSDAILRVKVTTVTGKQEEGGPAYEIGLKQIEWIGGDHPPGTDQFAIKMQKSLTMNGIMKNFEGRLVGVEFIGFLKQFQTGDQNDHEFHMHLSPATKEVKDAIGDAIVLRELKQ